MVEVVDRVGLDLFGGQPGTGLVTPTGVSDQGRVVADDDHGLVAQGLELPHLSHGPGVPEMQVDAGGVDAVLDSQRRVGGPALLQLLDQFRLGHDLLGSPADHGELFVDWGERHREVSTAAWCRDEPKTTNHSHAGKVLARAARSSRDRPGPDQPAVVGIDSITIDTML